jgi:hypothetical protein
MPKDHETPEHIRQKLVVNIGGKTVKGYAEFPIPTSLEDALSRPVKMLPDVLELSSQSSSEQVAVSVQDAKAVFFVKSFEGSPEKHELKFFKNAPIIQSLWVRIQTRDGEMLEGVVDNSKTFLIDSGIFLIPTDDDSNNELIYLNKAVIAEFQVLGLRKFAGRSLPKSPKSDN